MTDPQPIKTFRVSVDEAFSHRDEITPGVTLELNVFEAESKEEITLEEVGQVQRAKPIYSADTIKQQVAKTVRGKFRRQGFEI